MKRLIPFEFVYQIFALLISIIIVHAMYVTVVRPQAQDELERQKVLLAQTPDAVVEQNLWVVLKDYEQEACFVLFFWALAILGYKGYSVTRERALLERALVEVPEGTRILPEDIRPLRRRVQALPAAQQQYLLPRVLLLAMHRFESTKNIQDVASAIHTSSENEGERLDAELSMIRYIAWAIPSIGFIGTVRGIGIALGQAHQAVEGDITGVTESLGTAFNSTLVALLLSILLMFIVHQLQLAQERLVLDVEHYGDRYLVSNLQTMD